MTESTPPRLPAWPWGAKVLPPWAQMSPERRDHAERVRSLLGGWAAELELGRDERARWEAAGAFHDALRDAEPGVLRELLGEGADGIPDPLLHGHAAAHKLAEIAHPEVVEAVRHHTTGRAGWSRTGDALYLADFLDPGRREESARTRSIRARVARDWEGALAEVLALRLGHRIVGRAPLHPDTVAFWNRVVEAHP